MIREPAPERVDQTVPGDIVEIAGSVASGPRVVRVEWKLGRGGTDAMCCRLNERTRQPIHGGTSMHFFVPGHIQVLRVIDPDAPVAPEQGETDAPDYR